jgi:hypothetical protein
MKPPLTSLPYQTWCRAGQYKDRSDCKCKACPPNTKPDPTRSSCVPDKPDDKPEQNKPDPNKPGDTKQKKESKWEETKKRMKDAWNKAKQDKENKDKKAGDEDKKDRKKERMGKCLGLVSLSIGKIIFSIF